MKKYLKVMVTDWRGNVLSNPLKLSEAYLISQLAQKNQKVAVVCTECSNECYKSIFG